MIGTFLPQVPEIIAPVSQKNKINIFTQMEPPETFNGIWIQTEDQYENIVTDNDWYFGGEFDKDSNFVKNLSEAVYPLLLNQNKTPSGFYIGTFLKYLDDYYLTIYSSTGQGIETWYQSTLYKIIINEDNTVSLSKICNIGAGGLNYFYQFGENGKYVIMSGGSTGNGDPSYDTYIFDFETLTIASIADLGSLTNIQEYKGYLFCEYTGDSTYGKRLYIINNFNFQNPKSTSPTLTSTSINIGTCSPLLIFNDKLICYDQNNNISELIFDPDTLSVSIGQSILSLTDDLGLTENTDFSNSRPYAFLANNRLLFNLGGNKVGKKYFIADLKDKTIIQKGDLSDIMYSNIGSINIQGHGSTGFGRMVQEDNGDLFGMFSRDGVLKYNVQSKQYEEKTVILSKTDPINGLYYTEFLTYNEIEDMNDGIHVFKSGFNDVLYFHNGSLDNTLPTYYGDGTQWIKFKN